MVARSTSAARFLLQQFEVGLLVEDVGRHVFEEASDLQAAELYRCFVVDLLGDHFQVIAVNLD